MLLANCFRSAIIGPFGIIYRAGYFSLKFTVQTLRWSIVDGQGCSGAVYIWFKLRLLRASTLDWPQRTTMYIAATNTSTAHKGTHAHHLANWHSRVFLEITQNNNAMIAFTKYCHNSMKQINGCIAESESMNETIQLYKFLIKYP